MVNIDGGKKRKVNYGFRGEEIGNPGVINLCGDLGGLSEPG